MRLSLVLLGLVLILAPYVSSVFFIPIATTTGATTTTVSISAASLATGAAVAAGGIVGLGLAAAAAAALSGRDEKECYGYGCGGGSYSSHHGKRRRDLNTDAADIDEVFAMVAKMDIVGCGLRLVCYIYKKDSSELSQRERGIRALLGETPQPVNPKHIKEPRSAYQSAAFFGHQGEDCVELYKHCPLDSKQALKLLNQIDLRETRDPQ